MSERPSIDPKLSFLAGFLLGRRRRRRSGVGCLVILVAILAGMMAVASLIGAPVAWNASRQTARLPQPTAAELITLPAGSKALVAARIPAELPVAVHGLALFRTDIYDDRIGDEVSSETSSSDWRLEAPVQTRFGMLLLNNTPLLIQVSSEVEVLNAQTIELDETEVKRRYVGYLPGQTVALEGVWEGDNLFTVESLYAGTVDDYLAHRARMPGINLMMALLCGGMAVLLLLLGGGLRLIGR